MFNQAPTRRLSRESRAAIQPAKSPSIPRPLTPSSLFTFSLLHSFTRYFSQKSDPNHIHPKFPPFRGVIRTHQSTSPSFFFAKLSDNGHFLHQTKGPASAGPNESWPIVRLLQRVNSLQNLVRKLLWKRSVGESRNLSFAVLHNPAQHVLQHLRLGCVGRLAGNQQVRKARYG